MKRKKKQKLDLATRQEKRRLRRTHAKQTILDTLFYIVGSALYALSVNIFSAPNNIAPGGLTGVATMLHYVFPQIPIGTAILVLNLPLLIASWFVIGRVFTLRTVICTVLVTLVIDGTAPFVPPFLGDPLLVAVFGGVFAGVGLGLIFLRGATTGGSEVVARLLERKLPYVPVGRLILAVDAVVVAASVLVFHQVESAMYAIILIFVSSRLLDAVVYGDNGGKLILIVSRKEEEIAAAIIERIGRGVTKLSSRGAYTGESSHMLLCAVRRSQMYPLRRLVSEIDKNAFIIITTTDEVLGEGFKPAEETKN